MNKKIKIIIVVAAIVVLLAIASVPVLKLYNNQEHIIVSKAFDVTIDKNADIIYFDDDDEYLHAAYGVSEEDYKALFDEIMSAGFDEIEINADDMANFEWIPADRIAKAYNRIVYGETTARIFVTELQNGFVELYFVK